MTGKCKKVTAVLLATEMHTHFSWTLATMENPLEQNENYDSYLLHRFRYHITFISSLILGGTVLVVSIFSELLFVTEYEVTSQTIEITLIWVIGGTFFLACLITVLHYWFDQRRTISIKRKPLKNLINDGFEEIDENVVGLHNGYTLNIAKVSHIKKLNSGAFVVHIYYAKGQSLSSLQKKYSFKTSEWSNIRFYESYLQFYFTKVLFMDSYLTLVEELDRVTSILNSHGIQPEPREKVNLKLIGNSKFVDALEHVSY